MNCTRCYHKTKTRHWEMYEDKFQQVPLHYCDECHDKMIKTKSVAKLRERIWVRT